jgi:hypothetical protein
MRVREDDLCNRRFIDAGSSQILRQPAIGRLVSVAAANVEEDQIARGAKDRDIRRRVNNATVGIETIQNCRSLFRRNIRSEYLAGYCEVAVTDDIDIEIAVPEPEAGLFRRRGTWCRG